MKTKMKKVFKDNKGFSMVELMVVIVIMLILAAIAIPSFNRLINQANEAAATSEARTVLVLAQLEAETMIIDGTSTTDIETALNSDTADVTTDIVTDAGLDTAEVDNFVFTVDADGNVTVTYTYDGTNTVTLP